MANLYDTECKEVMDTSNGDDHQLLGDGSHQLLRTEVAMIILLIQHFSEG